MWQGFVIKPVFSVSENPSQWRNTIPFNQIGKYGSGLQGPGGWYPYPIAIVGFKLVATL